MRLQTDDTNLAPAAVEGAYEFDPSASIPSDGYKFWGNLSVFYPIVPSPDKLQRGATLLLPIHLIQPFYLLILRLLILSYVDN